MIEVINGNVDKGTFLEFIRYCDESISKLITGQVLSSNATQNGTQALGAVHNEMQKNATEFDAILLSESLHSFLKHLLELNFSSPAPFSFEIDTNTEKDEKLTADTYLILSQMGVKIPIEHLEKTFKINGLAFSHQDSTPIESLNKAMIDPSPLTSLPSSVFSVQDFLKDAKSFEEAHQKILESYEGEELLTKEQELMDLMLNAAAYGANEE